MNRKKLSGILALTLSAVVLAGCSVDGGNGRGASEEFDASTPIEGADQGTFDASPDEIREGLKADPWWAPSLFVDCDATDDAACEGEATEGVYNAIPSDLATEDWRICAVVPHLSDAYWVAVNYGMVEEARRLGVNLDFYEAGGYTELSTQVSQIDDCVAGGADAVIIGAISADGLKAKVDQLVAQGTVVIDALNGIVNPDVDARSVLSWRRIGTTVGDYLANQGGSANVAWFPGPPGAGWAEDANDGFAEAVQGSGVDVVETKYGDTDKDTQLRLIEDTLQANDGVTVIAGNAVGADAAAAAGFADKATIIGSYMTPETLANIERGKVACAATDQPAVQARVAVDMTVRLLQGIPLDEGMRRAYPAPYLVCGEATENAQPVSQFVAETTFAPEGWKPVFTVKAD
ncbi:TMAO reductase system periplasmic protein TorT [Nocardioides sp. IC4_145]|uniref:TMAO reductase system periplasmic protein TorT n=1 Tax=Nocardioides sp. IC4_145 TaxID=2714037 RepID=UPI00140D1C26|nr:TMAO reductase system periplasmic protein TorT [Nocardioides sp. IC4_145]NHC24343.1 TMAO reductase system periplasmic protein TorT [Nocardioides sp. IC4_145]